MLKKAGILVGIAAAGVLALTPMAFAWNDESQEPVKMEQVSIEDGNLTNECELGQAAGMVDQNLAGGDSVLGVAGAVTGAVAPVTTQTQALNCANIGLSDVVDSGSNNETRTRTETEVEDSYNESFTVED